METLKLLRSKFLKNRDGVTTPRPQCTVSAGTALILHVSRVFGVAPLHFRQHQNNCLVSVSSWAYLYSVVVTLAVGIIGVTGLVIDLQLDSSKSLRTGTPTRRILWITDFSVVMVTTIFGALEAPIRLNNMIRYLDQVQKIKMSINIQSATRKKNEHNYLVWLALLSFAMLLAADYYTVVVQATYLGRSILVMYFYVSYAVAYFMLTLLEIQFIYGVVMVYTTLKAINKPLLALLCLLQSFESERRASNTNDISSNDDFQYNILIRSINAVIDTISRKTSVQPLKGYTTQKPRSDCETVRHLAVSFIKLCVVVRQANKCHAISVLLLFATTLTHLIVTPYYLLLSLFGARSQPHIVILELLWCIRHLVWLVMLVEPCHWTQDEADHTQRLVSRLTARLTASKSSLSVELETFFKHLALNKITYSPLGICTFVRPLCASVMGSITTFLVILMQFQTTDEKSSGVI